MVVFDISSFVGINGFVDAGMGNVDTNPFPKGTGYGVCGVNPAIGIEHIFWDVLSMHTVNGITHILSSGSFIYYVHYSVIIGRNPIEATGKSHVTPYTRKSFSLYFKFL